MDKECPVKIGDLLAANALLGSPRDIHQWKEWPITPGDPVVEVIGVEHIVTDYGWPLFRIECRLGDDVGFWWLDNATGSTFITTGTAEEVESV